VRFVEAQGVSEKFLALLENECQQKRKQLDSKGLTPLRELLAQRPG
jgi:hypothetical protein